MTADEKNKGEWYMGILPSGGHGSYCHVQSPAILYLLLTNAASEEVIQFQENASTLIKTYLLGVGMFSIITIN